MTLPNAFLLGTPRSGTSSLFTWLTGHPDVAGTVPKEPFYLMDADSPLLNPRSSIHLHGRAGYRRFFSDNVTATVRLDGCCQYLYQQTALDFVRDHPGETRCIVLLRDPVARVRSAFRYFAPKAPLADGHTDLLSLVEALLRPDVAVDDLHISESPRYNHLLVNLVRHSEYVTHLRRWRDALAGTRGRLLLYSFEDLRADPARLLGWICTDLEIDAKWINGRRFAQENAARLPKVKWIDNWMTGLARRVPSRGTRAMLLRWNARWNSTHPETSARDREALRQLEVYFTPYNAALAAEFGVDVTRHRAVRDTGGEEAGQASAFRGTRIE